MAFVVRKSSSTRLPPLSRDVSSSRSRGYQIKAGFSPTLIAEPLSIVSAFQDLEGSRETLAVFFTRNPLRSQPVVSHRLDRASCIRGLFKFIAAINSPPHRHSIASHACILISSAVQDALAALSQEPTSWSSRANGPRSRKIHAPFCFECTQ